MLKGQAKKDYQRRYMKERRLKGRLLDPSVRPNVNTPAPSWTRPELDADGNTIYNE